MKHSGKWGLNASLSRLDQFVKIVAVCKGFHPIAISIGPMALREIMLNKLEKCLLKTLTL